MAWLGRAGNNYIENCGLNFHPNLSASFNKCLPSNTHLKNMIVMLNIVVYSNDDVFSVYRCIVRIQILSRFLY